MCVYISRSVLCLSTDLCFLFALGMCGSVPWYQPYRTRQHPHEVDFWLESELRVPQSELSTVQMIAHLQSSLQLSDLAIRLISPDSGLTTWLEVVNLDPRWIWMYTCLSLIHINFNLHFHFIVYWWSTSSEWWTKLTDRVMHSFVMRKCYITSHIQ